MKKTSFHISKIICLKHNSPPHTQQTRGMIGHALMCEQLPLVGGSHSQLSAIRCFRGGRGISKAQKPKIGKIRGYNALHILLSQSLCQFSLFLDLFLFTFFGSLRQCNCVCINPPINHNAGLSHFCNQGKNANSLLNKLNNFIFCALR